MRMKTLRNWAAVSAFCAVLSLAWRLTADGQVPLVSSFVYFSQLATQISQGGYLGWNKASVGESDFHTVPGSGVGGYNWYNGPIASETLFMHLDGSTGVLTNNNGFVGPLTGNVVGNLTGNSNGTHTGAVVGNASTATTASALASTSPCGSGFATGISTSGTATGCGTNIATATLAAAATQLAATPGSCANYLGMYGISANGTPTCLGTPSARTTSVTSTAATPYAQANTTVPISITMPDTNYSASCAVVNPFGVPSIMGITKTTTTITVTLVNGGTSGAEVVSGGSEIDCTITGF